MQLIERGRSETIERLLQLRGVSLWALASYYDVLYIGSDGEENPLLITSTLERYLELPSNSLSQTRFFDEEGPWDLECVPLIHIASDWKMSDNLAISRIEEKDPLPEFEKSNLYSWITRHVVLGVGYFKSIGKPEPRYEVI